ncbi:SAM-dependent methyltransferase [Haloprofundus marisrubri]|uniref:SAM-dependent methyltransferase n=1 Tax=Haloprofundus marisrubri TaxID=1514971 RepID=A0A0W1R615_9EURY|nr:class I SAM-dependent methyltransferase [Haloprofundus marisrubri]KTG08320.1 SAM-dependent methyltransferase [Haloprofundus marisrubri]
MAEAADTTTPNETEQTEALAGGLFADANATLTLFSVYLGTRLGLYDALADADTDALTPSELAAQTETDERYVREWLEHQTVSGILTVDDERAAAGERRYSLPEAHEPVLVDVESLYYLAPLARAAAGLVGPLDDIVAAYRTGEGVAFADYGANLHEGQAAMNRPAFLRLLGEAWLSSIPDVHGRLSDESPARVADIGCGHGWSSIGIAQAYPNAHVDGYDLDEASIEAAKENAEAYGLTDRVNFEVRDASDSELAGRYDLVTAFECVHDMADPVGALATMRRLANGTGAVIVMDERVGDEFTADADEIEQFLYGCSVFHCLPVGRVGDHSAATGTVMRTETLGGYADEAGFESFEVLPIENEFFRFYRMEA